jgi:hypothetical protein
VREHTFADRLHTSLWLGKRCVNPAGMCGSFLWFRSTFLLKHTQISNFPDRVTWHQRSSMRFANTLNKFVFYYLVLKPNNKVYAFCSTYTACHVYLRGLWQKFCCALSISDWHVTRIFATYSACHAYLRGLWQYLCFTLSISYWLMILCSSPSKLFAMCAMYFVLKSIGHCSIHRIFLQLISYNSS